MDFQRARFILECTGHKLICEANQHLYDVDITGKLLDLPEDKIAQFKEELDGIFGSGFEIGRVKFTWNGLEVRYGSDLAIYLETTGVMRNIKVAAAKAVEELGPRINAVAEKFGASLSKLQVWDIDRSLNEPSDPSAKYDVTYLELVYEVDREPDKEDFLNMDRVNRKGEIPGLYSFQIFSIERSATEGPYGDKQYVPRRLCVKLSLRHGLLDTTGVKETIDDAVSKYIPDFVAEVFAAGNLNPLRLISVTHSYSWNSIKRDAQAAWRPKK